MKLMIIDGNNLAIRSAFANSELSAQINISDDVEMNPDDIFESGEDFPTGVFHGFFRTLAMLRKSYPEHNFVIAWDGGNTRRKNLTIGPVKDGLIPAGYKENRLTEEPKREIVNFLKQKDELRKALSFTNIPQIVVKDEEADDVAASYVKKYSNICEQIILYTTDKDYYQLLSPVVSVLRANDFVTEEMFTSQYGISPKLWVDVGAFMGDDSDNIFGVPGWGEKTSLAAIQQNGSFEAVYESFHKECDELRVKYPDLSGEDFVALCEMKSPTGKLKYPGVFARTPFTGVAMAVEKKAVKKPKSVINALMHEERAILARLLKQMIVDLPLPNLPGTLGVPLWERKMEKEFLEFCNHYSLNEVSDEYEAICSIQPNVENSVIV